MKPLHRIALYALLLDDCESVRYQSKLREMAAKQIHEYQAGETTYQVGVDFMTDEPRFRLMSGKKPDERTIGLFLDLQARLSE